MRCREIQELLPEYADGALSGSRESEVAAHLEACWECRDELSLLHRSLGALDRTARVGAPDLWATFQQRLAVEQSPISCADAREQIPAYVEGASILAPEPVLSGHLDVCAGCRREYDGMATAVETLDRVAQSVQAPDLWPAFAVRLKAEEAARWSPGAWLRSLGAALTAPALRPAYGIAALVLAVVVLQSRQSSGPRVAVTAPQPEVPIATGSVTSPASDKTSVANTVETPHPVRNHPVRLASVRRHHVNRAAPVVVVAHREPVTPEPVRMAWTPRILPASVPAAQPDSGADQTPAPVDVKAEVVAAVEMLAGLEETAKRPFEATENGQ